VKAPDWISDLRDYLEPEDWEWFEDEECWISRDEEADRIPEWRIYSMCAGYWIHYRLGWYEQRGDAEDKEKVRILMDGMEAAEEALGQVLNIAAL
jgi:hypothetical protein